ncbi:EamA family transporter [Terrabacter aeriphilus]|uniref:EamA family transporter n=1 Tax=Terrabacter aeriphilus TaxID=515662 RepID=A0ABP9JG94_9MICO
MRSGTGLGTAAVLLAALLWGTTGTAAAFAPGVSGLAVGAAAMGLGGLLQAAAAAPQVRRYRGALRMQWPTVAVSAVAVAVFPLAFYSSMRLTGVAVGTVVTIGSAPPAAALIERAMDGTRLSRRWALGTGLGVLGVTALALAHSDPSGTGTATTGGWGHVAGIGLGLLGGATYALYSWGAARVIRTGIPSRASMGAIFGLGAVLLMPVLVLTGSTIVATRVNLAVVAYLALIPMFLGYVLFGRGLASVSASTATTLSLAEPAAAAVIAMLVLHEQLTGVATAGLVLLFASLAATTLAPRPTSAASRPVRRGTIMREPLERA